MVVWALLPPALMSELARSEYHVLRALFGVYRKPNGSRLVKARMAGIDYQIVNLTRRHLLRLEASGLNRVNYARPNWQRESEFIRRGRFTVESFLFLDAMGLIQNEQGQNIFYRLKRNRLANGFDLWAALRGEFCARSPRIMNSFERKMCQFEEAEWKQWVIPDRFKRRSSVD